MRVAHGLFLWQEPRSVLEPCLRSTVPHVDEVIIAEGLIEGVPDLGLAPHTDLAWLAEPSDWLPEHIWISSHENDGGILPWSSIAAACDWILAKARALHCDWLLFVDADQELHEGESLKPWLADLGQWPVAPLGRREPDGKAMPVLWQLLNVHAVRRYLSGCHVVELASGPKVSLVPPGPLSYWPVGAPAVPWLSHHPERRPPWRRSMRLGAYENLTEPPHPPDLRPFVFPPILAPVSASDTSAADPAPAYYCPACGARYQGPGSCANNHPPTTLEHDPNTPLASGDADPAPAAESTIATDSGPADQASPAAAAEGAEPAEPPAGGEATTQPATDEATGNAVEPPPDASPPPASAEPAAVEPVTAPADSEVTPGFVASLVAQAKDLLDQAAAAVAKL